MLQGSARDSAAASNAAAMNHTRTRGSGLQLVDADDAGSARFGAPRLARPAGELAHVGARLVGREGKEGLALGIETQHGIGCREVGEPDGVTLVDRQRATARP